MANKTIIWVVIIAALLVFFGFLLFSGNSEVNNVPNPDSGSANQVIDSGSSGIVSNVDTSDIDAKSADQLISDTLVSESDDISLDSVI